MFLPDTSESVFSPAYILSIIKNGDENCHYRHDQFLSDDPEAKVAYKGLLKTKLANYDYRKPRRSDRTKNQKRMQEQQLEKQQPPPSPAMTAAQKRAITMAKKKEQEALAKVAALKKEADAAKRKAAAAVKKQKAQTSKNDGNPSKKQKISIEVLPPPKKQDDTVTVNKTLEVNAALIADKKIDAERLSAERERADQIRQQNEKLQHERMMQIAELVKVTAFGTIDRLVPALNKTAQDHSSAPIVAIATPVPSHSLQDDPLESSSKTLLECVNMIKTNLLGEAACAGLKVPAIIDSAITALNDDVAASNCNKFISNPLKRANQCIRECIRLGYVTIED